MANEKGRVQTWIHFFQEECELWVYPSVNKELKGYSLFLNNDSLGAMPISPSWKLAILIGLSNLYLDLGKE